jgi:hypothetical protein
MGGRAKGTSLWRGGIVPYEINPDLANIIEIHSAIAIYEQQTNIRFVGRFIQEDYVRFAKQTSGSPNSNEGRVGGKQYLSASTNNVGALLHEMGHAVGLMHEHQRADRDDYVIFNSANATGDSVNYEKRDTHSRTAKYDFQSIMHYQNDPAAPVYESVTGIPAAGDIGLTGAVTFTDREMLESMYPAAPVIRRSDGQGGAGPVLQTSSIVVPRSTTSAILVNAIRNGSENYQLILWKISKNGLVERLPDAPGTSGGRASGVPVAALGRLYVAVMRDADDELYLITHSDSFARLKDSGNQAGEVRGLDVVVLSISQVSRVVTPCISASDRILNIVWEIRSDGTIVRLFDSGTNGPSAKRIASTTGHDFGAATVLPVLYTNEDGRVVLSTWAYDGNSISFIADSKKQMGKGDLLQLVRVSDRRVVVVCRNASDNLMLIPFEISDDGAIITRIRGGEGRAGKVREISAIARPYGVLTSVISGGDHALLIKWEIDADGFLKRRGESGTQAGTASAISSAALPFPDSTTICTVVRNGSGNLLPITWDDADGPGELSVI